MTCKIVQIANCSITKYANSRIIAKVMQETKLINSDSGVETCAGPSKFPERIFRNKNIASCYNKLINF